MQERWHGLRVSDTGRSFLATLTSLSAQQLVENLSRVASDCMSRVATIGDPISEFEVFKRQSVNHCCLLESTRRWVEFLCRMVTKVTCSTKVRMLRKKLMHGSRDSQYYGCTVAYKENNVYNVYMKPRGNKTDAMPLSEDSDNRSSSGCRPGPNLLDRKIQIQKIQEEQKEHMIQCEMMRWMVKISWCRGCQIYLLNPVQDRSPNTS